LESPKSTQNTRKYTLERAGGLVCDFFGAPADAVQRRRRGDR
jgi:hypothetical protein